ncbi:MAG: polysaccharide deacetylase family protein [Snowella sp.]|nr:polysaccharide deacetylase family protein [Snowella sp.]
MGMNGSLAPDLLHQIINQGHEIGSHTFTHPNIAKASQGQLELELNSTQRLLEEELGLRTVLFRPPYAEDVEPETPDQVAPLEFTGRLGYYTVGMQIDPSDWSNPDINKIVSETLRQAESGIGNIVLLHDSGGDRSQTVAALPKIIEGLKQRGFELVTVSQLIGLPRTQVMPLVPKSDRFLVDFDKIGFRMFDDFNLVVYYAFVIGISLSVGRLLLIIGLALYEWYRRRKCGYLMDY